MTGTSSILRSGFLLDDRYRIVKQIGQGGFGRTYVAEDINRYNEKCVLKEFAPLVENDTELQKAEELFEREAGILYGLEHDRIPHFKALLRTRVDRKKALFLVQEYIKGETYQELLKNRGKLTEAEVIDLIIELLPVLEYIHQQNLIHRDISPDNLIYRHSDKKPVLIDFGCVKLAANAVSRSQGQLITLIGKKGFSPEEQISHGKAFPCSDLYALAATAVVLLTGQSPEQLYDAHSGKWQWEEQTKVSSHLSKILNKMLAYKPSDRYQNVSEVINAVDHNQNSLVGSWFSHIQTLIVAPKNENKHQINNDLESPVTTPFQSTIKSNISRIKTKAVTTSQTVSRNLSNQVDKIPYVRHIRPWQWAVIVFLAAIMPGIISFSTIRQSLFNQEQQPNNQFSLTKKERDQQQKIYQRVKALKLNEGNFYTQVDQEFYRQYPIMKNKPLTDKVEHLKYRQIWYQIAEDLLDKKDQLK